MSLTHNPVQWFEIPVKDLVAATTFYEELFETKTTPMEMGPAKMSMFHYDENIAGTAGALVLTEGYTPSRDGAVLYFTVNNLDTTVDRVTGLGGKILQPRLDIGQHGFIALIQDNQGNRIGLHCRK